jgi:phage shock protein C
MVKLLAGRKPSVSPSGVPSNSLRLDKEVGSRARSAWHRRHASVKGGAVDPTNKLYRSKTNRKLAGVCGGLAQYFNLDATLIRVLFVVLAVLGGSGLVLYLAMWIIVPNEP